MVGFNILNQSARERVFPQTLAKRIGTLDMFAVRRAFSDSARLVEIVEQLIADGKVEEAGIDRERPLQFLLDDGLADTAGDACQSGLCQGLPTHSEPTLVVESLSPSVVSPGLQTIAVHGHGFVPRATLSFLRGRGRPPKVKSLRLVDDRLLEATIRVSRKGPSGSRFFDALVTLPDGTSNVLPEALRIDP